MYFRRRTPYPILLMRSSLYLIAFVGLISGACASGPGSSSTGSAPAAPAAAKASVHVDLARYRPKFEAPAAAANPAAPARPDIAPTHHINGRVHTMLDSLAQANRGILYAQGYRILAYTGNERQEAMNMRKVIAKRLPNEEEYFTYQQPTFRIKVGDYLTRLEAREALNQILDVAPRAVLVQEQVVINKPVKQE